MSGGETHNKSLEELFGNKQSQKMREAGDCAIAKSDNEAEADWRSEDGIGTVDLGVGSWTDENEGGTSDSLFSDDETTHEDVAWSMEKKGISEENLSSSVRRENNVEERSSESEEDSQKSLSPIKSFSKYLPKFKSEEVISPQLEEKDSQETNHRPSICKHKSSGYSKGSAALNKTNLKLTIEENHERNSVTFNTGNDDVSEIRTGDNVCCNSSQKSSQENVSPCKSFLKYLPSKASVIPCETEKDIVQNGTDCLNVGEVKEIKQAAVSNLKTEKDVILIDLTEPELELKDSQSSEESCIISPSVKSSQETYLSPSKIANSSQEIFLLSSPASNDDTSDCIELI